MSSGAKIVVLGCVLAASSSRASLISQTSTPLDESILVSGAFSDPLADAQTVDVLFNDYAFTFDQFDPSLGTLTDIRISYYFSYTASATANSQPNEADKYLSLSLHYNVQFEGPGGSFDGDGNGSSIGSGTAGESLTTSATISENDASVFYDPIFTDVQGTGTYNVSVAFMDADQNATVHGYFTDYEIKRDAGAYFQIDYEYEAVPEPAAIALISMAGCGMLVARRFMI